MPRGGYRGCGPGFGRPRGSGDKKPRKKYAIRPETEAAREAAKEERQKIKELLAHDKQAKAKMYNEFMWRVSGKPNSAGVVGTPLSIAEKKLMIQLGAELRADQVDDGDKGKEKKTPTVSETDAPDFLRTVWNDPTVDMALRIRAAEIIVRGGEEKKGKKDIQADKAKRAGGGRFAAGAPPTLKVVGK